jgi:hypothetical protein
MKYLSILLLFVLTSCSLYDRYAKDTEILKKVDTIETVKYNVAFGTIIPDTLLNQLRAYKIENHLLRVEVDDLKRRIKNYKKLKSIDSILRTYHNEIK